MTSVANSEDNLWSRSINDSRRSSNASLLGRKKGFRKMYLAAGGALMFAVAMGTASGYSATATENMKRRSSPVQPNENEIGWIGSLLAIGALIGGIIAGKLSDTYGRKGVLLISSIPFMTGWLLIAYANSVTLIIAGRILTGLCCGLATGTTPAYLVEISTPEVRGLLGASFQLFVVLGVLIITALGSIMNWEWLAVAGAVTSVIALIIMLPLPESPRWLVIKGRYKEAVDAIQFLQGNHFDAAKECQSIDEDLRLQPKGRLTLEDFRKPTIYKPALLSVGLVFFQQACGSNSILFYTVSILKSAGSSLDPNVASIIVDVVLVLATLLSSVLMDKAGRKILLVISGAGMAVSLGILGGYDYASNVHPAFRVNYGWIPLVSLMIYIAAFSLGFGPITWLMTAEITPVSARGFILGGATAICWGFVFIVTKTFDNLKEGIHDYGAYWFYAGFSLLSCFFAWFCLPETKGKRCEEIQEFFIERKLKLAYLPDNHQVE